MIEREILVAARLTIGAQDLDSHTHSLKKNAMRRRFFQLPFDGAVRSTEYGARSIEYAYQVSTVFWGYVET